MKDEVGNMEQNFVDTLAWDLPTLQELVLESCPGYVTAIREATYQAALPLVDRIEPSPGAGRLDRHYRTRAGKLLTTLDEVVRAILDNDLKTI